MKRAIIAALMASTAFPALAGQVPAISDGSPVPQIKVGFRAPALTAAEKHAMKLAKRVVADQQRMPKADEDGVIRFEYGKSHAFTTCTPGAWCVIHLRPGELITGGNGGNAAFDLTDSENWIAKPFVIGSGETLETIIRVSPKYADAAASMIVGTNEGRIYNIALRGSAGDMIPDVGWTYVEDIAPVEVAPAVSPEPETPLPTLLGTYTATSSQYKIKGDASWRPYSAYTSEGHTVVDFPYDIQTTPSVVGLEGGGIFSSPTETIVNYRMLDQRRMMIDGTPARVRITFNGDSVELKEKK